MWRQLILLLPIQDYYCYFQLLHLYSSIELREIVYRQYFLIIFLVLIDTLAVSWKAMAKRGPYDDYLTMIEDDVASDCAPIIDCCDAPFIIL